MKKRNHILYLDYGKVLQHLWNELQIINGPRGSPFAFYGQRCVCVCEFSLLVLAEKGKHSLEGEQSKPSKDLKLGFLRATGNYMVVK